MIGTHVEDVRAQIGVAGRFMTPSLPRTTTWAKKQSKILKEQQQQPDCLHARAICAAGGRWGCDYETPFIVL